MLGSRFVRIYTVYRKRYTGIVFIMKQAKKILHVEITEEDYQQLEVIRQYIGLSMNAFLKGMIREYIEELKNEIIK